MRRTLSLLLVTSLTLAACGSIRDSRINPLNWFGRGQPAPVQQQAEHTNPLIPARGGLFANRRAAVEDYAGIPFEQVTALTVERIPGGAIVRATGLAARQGIYAVQLTPANDDEEPVNGVLTYRLEGVRPQQPTAVGAVPTREVIAARRLTDQQLRAVSQIRVEGQLNAQVARR
ncbi:hypothetical protein H9Q16_05495 [Sulfitobacter sp. TSTF-M16]|uniref:Lipoprotein n=1 Tax=Sulfitobacter aestuariivivens TaxID=2766981 RepID=A0A927HEG6_9RHOB|nr:hypothetical protein [Sulfitobacter aestuariivivens]MBD3663368.1 hypothetical protein [Sulfitobacter aestuariivivens]